MKGGTPGDPPGFGGAAAAGAEERVGIRPAKSGIPAFDAAEGEIRSQAHAYSGMTKGGPTMRDLDHLLEETSRTFALAIPRLPEPTREEVTIAYLLFRIADTFEDASDSDPDRRISALNEFGALLRDDDAVAEVTRRAEEIARDWLATIRIEHGGYRELLEETPFVIERFRGLRPDAVAVIRGHVLRTAEGMAGFVRRAKSSGELEIRDLDELRDYCYTVAGIVGEMLTELFLLGPGCLDPVAEDLRARAREFGEGLQLVNILKDARTDRGEGRRYLPPGVDRSQVFDLARRDLDRAAEYVLALQSEDAPPGLVAFTAMPVKLAWATLDVVETRGPGAKITRDRVWRLVGELESALDEGRPAVRPARLVG